MGNCIRTEMWKAFHNKMMRSALLIGFILVIADLVQTAITVSDLGASYAHSPGGYDGCSLFVNWIGVNGVTVGAVVFYAVWPFLAAMPYGWSLYEDNRSHMTNNILTRVSYSQYLTAKMAAVFVSGGIAIALPVTADLFASAMICPACIPRVTLPITGFCSGTAFLAKLYYTHPWLHAIIWCVIEFFWGGVAASLCIIVGHKVKHRFFVTATPLLLFLLLDFITPLLFSMRLFAVYRSVQFYCNVESISSRGSIGDYMLCLFRGMAIIQHGSMEEKVSIPIEWLIVCGFCLYITAAYPAQGISVQGQQVFLRTSRVKWWLSKCIWCIASCTLYFACEMIAIIGTAILTPVTFGLNNTPEITAFLFSEVLCGETISLTPASVILYALILPFVTLTAVCMLQTLLSLVVRPAISFLICFVTYIAAAYFPIEWLVGNGAMVMRYQLFDANGLSYRKELVFTLLLMLLSIGAGYLLIQRKDLISLEK